MFFQGVPNFVRLAGLGGSSWEDDGQFDLEAIAVFGLYRFKSFDPDVEFSRLLGKFTYAHACQVTQLPVDKFPLTVILL